jgi:hypothetical protein
MKAWEKLALWFLFAFVFCGCATSKSSESSFQQEKDTQTDRVITDGLSLAAEEKAGPSSERPADAKSVRSASPVRLDSNTLPDHGPLIKETVTVTEQAPITTTTEAKTDTHQEASTGAQSEAQSKSKPSLGFLTLPVILIAGGAILALLVAWKTGLLSKLIKLVVA